MDRVVRTKKELKALFPNITKDEFEWMWKEREFLTITDDGMRTLEEKGLRKLPHATPKAKDSRSMGYKGRKKCEHCHKWFPFRTYKQIYCSDNCRNKAAYRRKQG